MFDMTNLDPELVLTMWSFALEPLNQVFASIVWNVFFAIWICISFLASQDALEVMRVTHSLSEWVIVSIDFTDVTLVSEDTDRRLYWCDPGDPDDHDKKWR